MKAWILPAAFFISSLVPLTASADPMTAAAVAEESSKSSLTPAQLTQELRRLWSEHVIWTREYVVAAVDNHPSAAAAAARLLRNQEDIGKAVALFYGDAAGQQLATLLKEHITVAVDVVKAAKGGDKAAYAKADEAWQQNAVAIAEFLSKANPNWPRAVLVDMMKEHLTTTTATVVARLNKDWEADARAFDKVYAHILHMSDALAAGIVKQFPGKFAAAGSVASTH